MLTLQKQFANWFVKFDNMLARNEIDLRSDQYVKPWCEQIVSRLLYMWYLAPSFCWYMRYKCNITENIHLTYYMDYNYTL